MSTDIHDVAAIGARYYAVGDQGALYVGTSPTGPWTARDGGNDSWWGVTGVGADTGAAIAAAGTLARCTSNCSAPDSTWNPESTAVLADLYAVAGRGAHLWAVGAPADPGGPPTIQHFDGTTWGSQVAPSTVDEGLLASADGQWAAIATLPAGAAIPTNVCRAPSVRAGATVPTGPQPGIEPVTSARVTYHFPGSQAVPNQAMVLVSADGGATWVGRALPQNTTGMTTATVTFPGLTWDTAVPRTLQLCVLGAGDGGSLRLDMVHVDVQE